MKIAVVKEIKNQENRVALTPSGAAALVRAGHLVQVEAGAGLGSGFPDATYQAAGARVVAGGEAWDPVYEQHGVIHYCVTNMPGAYPRTSTLALTSATLPYVLQLANGGIAALRHDKGFGQGVNVYQDYITTQPVAEALGLMQHYKPFVAIAA